ncbi:MAG: hypothetical protein AB7O98_17155 [Hyphomonadaceae bacterium]
MAAKTAEYRKSENNGVTTFQVTPAAAPKFGCLLMLGGVIILLGLGFLADGGIFMLAMGAFALWYGWTRDLRPKEHRAPASFNVTPTSIEKDGRSFATSDIHRLLLRNAITDQELAGVQVYTDNPNVAAGMEFRAMTARVANALTLESGGKSTFLAGGMDETTAYGLMQDVSKIVGFDRPA